MVPELSNSGVPQSQIDILSSIYADAARKLADLVLHPRGVSESSRAFSSAQAAMMLNQIEVITQKLKVAAADWIGPNLRQAILDGATRGNQQLKAIGALPEGSPLKGSLSMIDSGTIAVLGRDMYADLRKAADSLGTNARRVLHKTSQLGLSESQIDRILAGGVIEGQPRQTIHQLRDALVKTGEGKVTIIDKNGSPIDFDADYYARLVVRTKTREATTVVRHERLSREGIDLVSIVGRVSKNFCTAYLGMVFSLSGKSEKYPALEDLPSDGPPFHPDCSKSTRPFVEDLATDSEEEMAEGVDGADKLVGVDAATAQKRFNDLQIYTQVRESYAATARKLFAKN